VFLVNRKQKIVHWTRGRIAMRSCKNTNNPMKFDASFLSSFSSVGSLPSDGRPELALIGRSNVGKSSLINALADRKQLAKTSGTPGKTRTLNYFLVNGEFYLVDMPGFGFAKLAKSERAQWARLTEQYFVERQSLTSIGLLIDARHTELESDMMALHWFRDHKLPFFIVLTKCDKAKQQDIARHIRTIGETYAVQEIFSTSSATGKGIAALKAFMVDRARTNFSHTSNSRAPDVFQHTEPAR
jgi:GTP-binding protein